jgi:23S rRNA (pseudouridine1915-N3)-methyltransferase
MASIHIITLGKLKEPFWKDAEKEYLKRLSGIKLQIHELKEESFTDKDPVELVKEKEAEKILDELVKIKNTFVIALEEKGREYTSTEFARQLGSWNTTHSSITFVIGGPLGLAPSIVARSVASLSLSPLTFTHQMTRVLLLEQIYRAFMIMAGRRYHY